MHFKFQPPFSIIQSKKKVMSSRRRNPPSSGNRFYTAPPVLRHQKMQQEQQAPEESAADQAEKCSGSTGDSIPAVEMSATPSVFSPSASKVTNLDRLMESLAPLVPSEVISSGSETREVDSHPFFYLEDLWESFREWSAYGAGVPLCLDEKDQIVQFYVPYLSGIQLYRDPPKPPSQLRASDEWVNSESYKWTSLASSSRAEFDRRGKSVLDSIITRQPSILSLGENKSVVNSFGNESDYLASSRQLPFFQYLEHEQPYCRRPLTDKILDLTSRHQELAKCRSSDLLETSWLCVAWYPIYRIPVGPTLREFEASFLTFYSLSTDARAVHHANEKKFSLPVFGLVSYKLRDSILNPCGPHELEQEHSLLEAADSWLRYLQVVLPDYQFFRAH